MEHYSQTPQSDELGNPVHQSCGTATAGTTGHQEAKLHRSGSSSSSSSSSEDDGQGGRRKKGIKEKIKEKLPGKHNEQTQTTAAATTTTPQPEYGGAEKKGIVDKIKDKLPGHHE